MLGPWLLPVLALTLTLTGAPGGRAQPPAEAAMGAEPLDLGDLLRRAERFLLLQEDVQRLSGDLSPRSEPQILQPDWLSKRQHPGKREEEAKEGLEEEEEEEGGMVGPSKRQHPGRREDEASWLVDTTQRKRQHPGRRSPWLQSVVTKRQHPGRRLVDAKAQGSWEEEPEEEEGEGALMAEKRQHPGKRSPRGCGPQEACGGADLLLGLLDDLSRGQKRQHPGRRASWAREPLDQ